MKGGEIQSLHYRREQVVPAMEAGPMARIQGEQPLPQGEDPTSQLIGGLGVNQGEKITAFDILKKADQGQANLHGKGSHEPSHP